MDITNCVNCGVRVIPKADHACPSCGKPAVVVAVPVTTSAASVGEANPYSPLSLNNPPADEIDVLIAKRERGIRTSILWMAISGTVALVTIVFTGYIYAGYLLGIAFLSGLFGFVVDLRALGRLQRQRSELTADEVSTTRD